MREVLKNENIDAAALKVITNYHNTTVNEVKLALQNHKIVVVGMRQNPVVKKALKTLKENNLQYHYLEYGSYFSQWKPRLAIKLWSGWPTFPQVFINQKLIGGSDDLTIFLKNNKVN